MGGAESDSKRFTHRASTPPAAKEGLKEGYWGPDRGETAKIDPLRGPVRESRCYDMAQNSGFGLF